MEEKKSIDRLFQEKLKDFESIPEPHIWKNIEQELTKKEKRRIVPLWLRLGSTAAVLLLFISAGFWYFDQESTLPNPTNTKPGVIDNETVQPKNDKGNDKLITDEKTEENGIGQQENTNSQETQSKGATTNRNEKLSHTTKKATQVKSSISQQESDMITNLIGENNKVEVAKNETGDKQTNAITEGLLTSQENDAVADSENKEQKDYDNNQRDNALNKGLINLKENNAIADNKNSEQKAFLLTKDDIAEAIENQLNKKNKDDNKLKKWSVGTAIAPVYFNTLSDGSPINESLASNNKETNTSLSYGVKVNYHINDRLSLQSGINSVELAYKTQGVTALIASSELQLFDTNIDTNINGVNLIAISNNQVAAQNSELSAQRGIVNLSGDLNQSLSYVEIPMEAKYALVNKKIGVHLVGGVSTYVLYRNQISLLDQNGSTTLGEASNINDVNFSGNLGIDLDYKLNKKLFINVSPMFKYQMNTFSKNDGGFQPYYLGVYTGLNFRF